MIRIKQLYYLWKRSLNRLRAGKAVNVVRTLAEEERGERPEPHPVAPPNQPIRARSAVTEEGDRTDWPSEGYPAVYRHPVSSPPGKTGLKIGPDIDLTSLDDLDACAEKLDLPAETLERWVGAGILSPRETEIAERLIRILRVRDQKKSDAKRRQET